MSILQLRIISGGQTGVDRAALDAAMDIGVPVGGWCPKGRRAADGVIDARYPLIETDTQRYERRTELNVRDAAATLLLASALPLTGGTALTCDVAKQYGKPWRIVLLAMDAPANSVAVRPEDAPSEVAAWLRELDVTVLNIAGPRESNAPGIHHHARIWILELLHVLARDAARRENSDTSTE
ncbi:MAG: putative molybdenum carrier protein [Bacteroidetes bacterium]|nr:putative molybdenum carrier protein [Bacteroidota bacterium]